MSTASNPFAPNILHTARLDLIPMTLDVVEAALDNPSRLGALLAAQIASGWPNRDLAEVLPDRATAVRGTPALAQWNRLLLTGSPRVVIGSAGFAGPPDEQGRVEIGYGIAPDYQGRGYATEAVQALIDWAPFQPGVQTVVALCLAENAASVRVLEKVGMQRLFQVGDTLYWERPV